MSERLLLTIEYDGSAYCGWQRQLNGPSVQQALEQAIHKLTGAHSALTGASRTDAGVHALGQRAHFDTNSRIPPDKWPFALNALLPRDIQALACQPVPSHFHARFNARGKTYRYRIFNRRQPSALLRQFTAHAPLPMDMDSMRRAAATLIGRHDFAAFQAAGGTAKTTVRTLSDVSLHRQDDEIILTVRGDAFLYNMVRIIAGTLMAIGQGKLQESAFQQAFDTLDRLALGPTAPAQGLCLVAVYYEGIP